MTQDPLPLKQIEEILADGPRNVVDLVEKLLPVFQSQAMRLEWEHGQCHFQHLPLSTSEVCSVPLPKSVFRAVLARVGVLCNEHVPDSVSLYGGEGEFFWESQPPRHFRIGFSNNPREGFSLEISPLKQPSKPSGSKSAHPLH